MKLFFLLTFLLATSLALPAQPVEALLAEAQQQLQRGRASTALYDLSLAQAKAQSPDEELAVRYWRVQTHLYRHHYNQALDEALSGLKTAPQAGFLHAALCLGAGQAYAALQLQDSALYYFTQTQKGYLAAAAQAPVAWAWHVGIKLLEGYALLGQGQAWAALAPTVRSIRLRLPESQAEEGRLAWALAELGRQFWIEKQEQACLAGLKPLQQRFRALLVANKQPYRPDLYLQWALLRLQFPTDSKERASILDDLAPSYGRRSLILVQLEWYGLLRQQAGGDADETRARLRYFVEVLHGERAEGYKARTLLAGIWQHQGRLAEDSSQAFEAYHRALVLLCPDLEGQLSLHQVGPLLGHPRPLSAWQTISLLEEKIGVYLRWTQGEEALKQLKRAKEHLEVVEALLKGQDAELLGPQALAWLEERSQQHLRQRWEVQRRLQALKPGKKQLDEWLEVVEAQDRLSLGQHFQDLQTLSVSGLSPVLIGEYDRHRREVHRLAARWGPARQEADQAYAKALEDAWKAHRLKLQGLKELFSRESALYRDLTRGREVLTLARLQRRLARNEACLLLHQQEGQYYLFGIRKDTVYVAQGQVSTLSFGKEQALVEAWLEGGGLAPSSLHRWTKRYLPFQRDLYERGTERLLLFPSGELGDLPWEALQLDSLGSGFLIERYALSYPLSLQRWARPRLGLSWWRQRALGWGGADYLAPFWVEAAAGAGPQQGAYALVHLDGPWEMDGGHFLEAKAPPWPSIKACVAALPQAELLVLARLKGMPNPARPQDWARHLQGQHGQAVLLPRREVEGPMLGYFYEALAQGQSPEQALRSAQLRALREGLAGAIWTSYRLFGQAQQPLALKGRFWYGPWLLGLVATVGALAYWFWRRKRNLG